MTMLRELIRKWAARNLAITAKLLLLAAALIRSS